MARHHPPLRALVVVGALLLAGCGEDKPELGTRGSIDRMSCDQLHAFYDNQITPNLEPDASVEDKQQAMKDAEALNDRIDHGIPGGCPGSDNW